LWQCQRYQYSLSERPLESLKIIGENANYYFIDKPAGLNSVRLPQGGGSSVADLILEREPSADTYSDKPEDAGLLNRLDRDTSGVLIAAKSRTAWQKGRDAMRAHDIKKSYLILLEGLFPENAIADTYIGTPHRGAKKVKIYRSKPAKSARAIQGITAFSLVKILQNGEFSLVRAECFKAQRHQVRAHAAHLGFPLVGDSLYGAQKKLSDVLPNQQREFLLHAEKLEFNDPISSEKIEIEAKLDFIFE